MQQANILKGSEIIDLMCSNIYVEYHLFALLNCSLLWRKGLEKYRQYKGGNTVSGDLYSIANKRPAIGSLINGVSDTTS